MMPDDHTAEHRAAVNGQHKYFTDTTQVRSLVLHPHASCIIGALLCVANNDVMMVSMQIFLTVKTRMAHVCQ